MAVGPQKTPQVIRATPPCICARNDKVRGEKKKKKKNVLANLRAMRHIMQGNKYVITPTAPPLTLGGDAVIGWLPGAPHVNGHI